MLTVLPDGSADVLTTVDAASLTVDGEPLPLPLLPQQSGRALPLRLLPDGSSA